MALKNNTKKNLFVGFNIFIALVGGFIIFYATKWDVWAFSDSATYFSAARNLAAGEGFIIQKTRGGVYLYRLFAPFYPILLSVVYSLIGNIFVAARLINIIAFSAFLFGFGFLIFLQTKQLFISLLGPTFLVVSPPIIENFTGAMTEPIFFATLIYSIIRSYFYVCKPSKKNLILYILTLSLLPFIRYAGIVFLFSNCLVLFFLINKNLLEKTKTILVITITSSIPTLLWLFYLYLNSNQIGGRSIQPPQQFFENIISGFKIVFDLIISWLPYFGIYEEIIPSSLRLFFLIVFFLCLTIISLVIIFLNKNKKPSVQNNLYFITLINSICFLSFIPFSYSLTNRSYVIDHRILSPLIPLFIAFTLLAIHYITQSAKNFSKYFWPILTFFFVIIIRFYALKSYTILNERHINGFGYTARHYQQSNIRSAIKNLPPDRLIISNLSGYILLYENHLPIQYNNFQNRIFGSGSSDPEVIFRRKNAALILFKPDFYNYYGEPGQDLYTSVTAGLDIFYEDDVSAIYFYPKQGNITQP